MHIPTTIHKEHIDAVMLSPQTDAVTRFKITIPVYESAHRMLAPLYAELLMRGTKSKTRKEFTEALETLGAELTVHSDRVGITITGCALSQTFSTFLQIMAEMLHKPMFSEKEVTQVHTQYAQALDDERDDARMLAYLAFTQCLYPKEHPYYAPPASTRHAFLKSVTRKTYFDFHTTLFTKQITVSISGTAKVQKELLDVCSSLVTVGDTQPPILPAVLAHTGEVTYQSVPSKANVELYIGNTLPLTLSDTAFLPFQFGLAILGKWGGFSGRLMSTVREKEGLTYTIYARTEGVTKTQSGMWYIFTFFTPADLERGLTATKREIKLITEKGVSEKEMIRFKELLKNQFTLAHESDAKALALYHDALCAGMTADDIVAQYEALQLLERKDVNKALAQYLQSDTLVISGAGPVKAIGKTRK